MAHRVDPDETANYEMKGLKPDQISGPFIYHIFRSIQKPKFFTSKTWISWPGFLLMWLKTAGWLTAYCDSWSSSTLFSQACLSEYLSKYDIVSFKD